jgi:DNA-directed RNA polymerase subunit alpha
MLEVRVPTIECINHSDDGFYGKYTFEPLDRGYGTTIGNALRRVLLSSLPGAAVTAIKVANVSHEFSTVPGVIEDMTEIILNIKQIRSRVHIEGPKTVSIHTEKGQSGPVTAANIIHDDELEIINDDLVLFTLNGEESVNMDLTFANGVGYCTADANKWPHQSIGVIPIDSIFNPVRKVNYTVESTRVGQQTNFDRLVLEIETDGTMNTTDALNYAAMHLIEYLKPFTVLNHEELQKVEEEEPVEEVHDALHETIIEDLDFSVRTYNCLKRAGINTVGDLVAKTEADMMKVRNLGKKSLEEVVLKLDELGLELAQEIHE